MRIRDREGGLCSIDGDSCLGEPCGTRTYNASTQSLASRTSVGKDGQDLSLVASFCRWYTRLICTWWVIVTLSLRARSRTCCETLRAGRSLPEASREHGALARHQGHRRARQERVRRTFGTAAGPDHEAVPCATWADYSAALGSGIDDGRRAMQRKSDPEPSGGAVRPAGTSQNGLSGVTYNGTSGWSSSTYLST